MMCALRLIRIRPNHHPLRSELLAWVIGGDSAHDLLGDYPRCTDRRIDRGRSWSIHSRDAPGPAVAAIAATALWPYLPSTIDSGMHCNLAAA